MKAVVYQRYGPPDVLQIREVPKPAPADDEILIRVSAATVTAADYRMRGFRVSAGFWLPYRIVLGLRGPKKTILGTEVAGDVESVGRNVTSFREGDRVFGLDSDVLGAYAEYVCRPEHGALATIPDDMLYEEAAAVPFGALAALHFLRDRGRIQSGQKVLIHGASGGVGTAAVQLARHFGAHVTGVCSTANLDLVLSLGAHRVIDYTREDAARGEETYDIIFDTVGKGSFSRYRKVLNPDGRYLMTVFDLPQLGQMLLTSLTGGRRVVCSVAPEKNADLIFIRGLMEAGEIRPVIDRTYSLAETAEAHRYAEKGHKRGSVVITVDRN